MGDGQRIVIAISDPLQLGWDLFDAVFYEPTIEWLPASLVWAFTFTAVVGGHVLGARAGHLGVDPPRLVMGTRGAHSSRLPSSWSH